VDGILAGPSFNPSNLINPDETAVRIFGGRNMTWGKIGAGSVWIDTAGSPKDCFTAPAGCSFDGTLLPPRFVAKGKTDRCHQSFGRTAPHWITLSEKGWMNGELLIDALRGIRELPCFPGHAKMAVVIDQAPRHMTVDVAIEATQLGTGAHPCPAGLHWGVPAHGRPRLRRAQAQAEQALR
jgi:hypothetical protein